MVTKKVIKKSALAPTVLISGGAGFIGSHLAAALLAKDARVVVLDNFKTGKKIYINDLLENPKFALFDVDVNIGLPEEIESVDYIFHLAGFEEYLFAKETVTLDTLLTNALGTKNLLDLARVSDAKFLLASTTNVCQETVSPLDTLNINRKSNDVDDRAFSHVEAKRYAEAVVWEYHKKYQTNVRIARLPEVYGPRMSLDASSCLGGFIKNLLEKKNITVFGDGVNKEHYLYVTDAVSGLIRALFSSKTNGNVYSLISNTPYAVLETAYLVKSLADGHVDIEFKPPRQAEIKAKNPDTSNLSQIGWTPKVDFKAGLIKTFLWFGYRANEHSFKFDQIIQNHKEGVTETLFSLAGDQTPSKQKRLNIKGFLASFTKSPKKASKTSNTSIDKKTILISCLTFLVSFLAIFIFVPALQVYVDGTTAYNEISKYPIVLSQLDTAFATSVAQNAYSKFSSSQNALVRLGWVFQVFGKKDQHQSLVQVLGSAKYFSKSAYNLALAATPVQTLWEAIRPNTTAVFNSDEYDKSKLNLDTAKNSLQLALANYKYVNTDTLPEQIKPQLTKYLQGLQVASAGIEFADSVYTDLPNLIGVQKSKKYLILFQNSAEIRPTGGFIGSYALLDLTRGKIEKLVIDDIYNPDGQLDLKGIKVAPPVEISDFLDEDVLHLRNANCDPDFTKSADIIKSLYTRVTGAEIDGVIAVDLKFTQKLLEITGPIFLTAYNEEISASNFYERAQFHSEFNYKDGSDQKKSFLTILGSKILEKVFALPKEKMPVLLSKIYESLNEKHLLVYIPDSELSGILRENNWDGSLRNTSGDYLYVVNSNLGGTKANYYVKNKMNYDITSSTRDGLLRGELILTYKHTGEDLAWPGGPYKNYVRVITQEGTRLTGASLTYQDKTSEDIFKQIKVKKAGRYDSYETSFVLNPKDSVKLVVKFDLPKNMSITKDYKNYDLFWQKQPGTDGDEIGFTFDAPFGVSITDVSPKTEFAQGFVKLDTTMDKNKEVSLKMR